MTLKVYHVILHRTEDLDAFYADMETPGGYLHIPDRAVDYAARLPFSKVTAYRLTDEEAEQVKQDPRVRAVEPALEDHGIFAKPTWTDTGQWRKDDGANATNSQQNWALYQCTRDTISTTYGTDGTALVISQTSANAEGKDVDVIVVDGIPNLDHPEFAVNADGTGGSRIIQYNWFQHTDSVTGGAYANGTWDYTTESLGDSENNNHGTHVMGTVAGNRQGWARKANLYSISPYGSNYNWTSTGISSSYVFDYVRAFHRNKSINPRTGRKNPTIINNSWGYSYPDTGNIIDSAGSVERIVFRGTTYNGPFTTEQMLNYGVPPYWAYTKAAVDAGIPIEVADGVYTTPPAKVTSIGWKLTTPATKTQECIDDGIIVVSAAGNSSQYIDSSNGDDYNNKLFLKYNAFPATISAFQGASDSAIYYHRGSAPGNTSLCIGNASIYQNNQREFSSNFGPRIDLFAPGDEIISAIRHNDFYDNIVTDPRNASYYYGIIGGTSMSAPQVTGVLASILQINPDFRQADAKRYIQGTAFTGAMFDSSTDWGNVTTYGWNTLYALSTDLKDTVDLYLRYREERASVGVTLPKINNRERPTTGVLWPRPKVIKTRRSTGDILYPSPDADLALAPLDAQTSYAGTFTANFVGDSAITYTGDFTTDYTSIDIYVNDSTGLDYSPAYASGYIGDFTAVYTGNYLGAYEGNYNLTYASTAYLSRYSATDYIGSDGSYETSYNSFYEGPSGTYLATYVGTMAYFGDYVVSPDELDYTTDYGVGIKYTGDYQGPAHPGFETNYIGSYQSEVQEGGGTFLDSVTYSGNFISDYSNPTDYVSDYTGNYVANYLATIIVYSSEYISNYAGNYTLEGYTGDFLANFTGTEAYTSDSAGDGAIIISDYLGTYTGNYVDSGDASYIGSYLGDFSANYTGNFSSNLEYTGGDGGTYLGAYLGNFSAIYTGNYVGGAYQATYVGASNTSLNVTNNGASNYIIDSASNPTLTLERDTTYTFNLSVGGHPFWIKTAATTGTGDQFNTGVTNNGAETGTLTFTPDSAAPSTLYYICQYHSGMVGTINIVAAGSTDYVTVFTGVDQENYIGDFTTSFTGGYNA